MLSRETVVRPLGLITQRNEYGQYPAGALLTAQNVCMRNPGLIEPKADYDLYRVVAAGGGETVRTLRRVFPTGATNLVLLEDEDSLWSSYWVTSGSSTSIGVPSGFTLDFNEGEARIAEARNRVLLSTANGVIVHDSTSDTSPRLAGLPAPGWMLLSSQATTNAQSMPTGKCCRYKAIFVSEQSGDGYVLRGAPCMSMYASNSTGSTVDNVVQVNFSAAGVLAGVAAGYFVELYRTDFQNTGTDPGESYRLVRRYTLTSTDITNKYCQIRDTVTDLTLGADLYTNSSQSDNGANFVPGRATDVFVFDGRTFYAQDETVPYMALRIPGTFGALSTDAERQYGIGTRDITGDTTASNATVLNVNNMRGIAVGQRVYNMNFVGGVSYATITAVAATSFTMDTAALSTNVGETITTADRMEISGNSAVMFSYVTFLRVIAESLTTYGSAATNVQVIAGTTCDGSGNQNGVDFVLQRPYYCNGDFTVRATNGGNYSPELPVISATAADSTSDPRSNRLVWSKLDQPEAVPPATANGINELLYGDGDHYRAIVRRDSVLLFASDGLWALSGNAGDYRVDLLTPDCILAARDAVCILDGEVFAYTNSGLVKITEGNAVEPVSKGLVGDLLPGYAFSDTWLWFMAADELHNEALLFLYAGGTSTTYVWNTLTKSFVTCDDADAEESLVTHFAYSPYERGMLWGVCNYIGDGDPALLVDSSTVYRVDYVVDFQPVTGDGDPFTLKQFSSCDLLFQQAATDYQVSTRFNASGDAGQLVTLVYYGYDHRGSSGIGRSAAIAPRLGPGFEISDPDVTDWWVFQGFSVRFAVQSAEVRR